MRHNRELVSVAAVSAVLIASFVLRLSHSARGAQMVADDFRPITQQKHLRAQLGRMPLRFEPNVGQATGKARFIGRGMGYNLLLTSTEAVLTFMTESALLPTRTEPPHRKIHMASVRIRPIGATETEPFGEAELPGKTYYFTGSDPTMWHPNIPNYARVVYRNLYAGIDWSFYGDHGLLESDFVLAPYADVRRIQVAIDGAGNLHTESNGDLVVGTTSGEVRLHKPVIYQRVNGTTRLVEGGYVLSQDRTVGFYVGEYDQAEPLIIDPVLIYSTFLGGAGDEFQTGNGIAVDSLGQVYITGETRSVDFPIDAAFQSSFAGGTDAFVSKLSPDGKSLVYSTYLGGSGGFEFGEGIAVDHSGNAYITGVTDSRDFPTTAGSFQTRFPIGIAAFVTKLSPSGELVYSTFLGGGNAPILSPPFQRGRAIGVDSVGSAYITGETESRNFPVTLGAIQENYGGGATDAFVSKLSADGSSLIYSTFLGGDSDDIGYGIAVDRFRNAYVTGMTASPNFRTSHGAFPNSVFVAKMSDDGSSLVYSTRFGDFPDVGNGIAVDDFGHAYVTGITQSSSFPTTPGAFQSACNTSLYGFCNGDAFVTKLSLDGSSFVYSTVLGGGDADSGSSIAVDKSGHAHVTGFTQSSDFPVTQDAVQKVFGEGFRDAFVTTLNATGTGIINSSFLGGDDQEEGHGIALDSAANTYVSGFTASTNFPVTPGVVQTTIKGTGNFDLFLAKLGDTSSTTVSFVYLGGRTSSPHTINAFSLQANGSAHLVPGSPFSAAALTSSSPQTLLAVSANFVFASDTENIATFRRSANGALTFASSVIADEPNIDTLTLDRTASNLYAGAGGPRLGGGKYSVFDKGTQGQLTAASQLSGVQPDGELQFNHSNKFAYTTDHAFLNLPEVTGQHCSFEAYSRATDGTLNPFDPQLSPPVGVAQSDFCPASVASSALGYLAVAYRTFDVNQGTGTGVHSIAVYRILTSGKLQFVSNLVTTLDAVLPITMKFDPSGTFLAAVGTQGIQLYKLSSGGTLTKSGSPLYTHTQFRDVRWDHSNHAITISFAAVYFFGLKNGQLVQTSPPINLGKFTGISDIRVIHLQ